MQFEFIDKQTFQTMAEQVGFEVLALYGDYDRRGFDSSQSPVMIWELQKLR